MMMNAGEPVLVCPYNKAHSIIKSRMQFHLTKCRLQCPNSEKVQCHFNSTHIIPKVELEFHEQVCENRFVIDSFLYNVGERKCPVEEVPLNAPPEALAPCEENWDEDPVVSVLDKVKELALEKHVLLHKIGAPKAERKAHRMQERLRYQRVADALEAEKKNESKTNNSVNKFNKDKAQQQQKPSTSKTNLKTTNRFNDDALLSIPSSFETKTDEDTTKPKVENDFEVVKYNKNKQMRKKSNNNNSNIKQPQPQFQQQKQTNDVLNQFSNLKLENHDKPTHVLHHHDIGGLTSTPAPYVGNAWEKPLNMRGQQGNDGYPMRHLEDFPTLPISGRGRAIRNPRQ